MGIGYNPRVVTDGLLLCFDAANIKSYPGSGTSWFDLSGKGNTGTLTNGPTYSSADGGTIVFDGTNDKVVTTSISFTNYTFDFFAKPIGNTLAGSTGYNTLAGYSSTRRLLWDAIGNFGEPGHLLAQVGSGNIISSFPATRNVWNHIAFTYNSSNITATWYINGVSAGSSSAAAQGTWNSQIHIGNYNANAYWMNGNISIVRIYNRALSATEISQNFNATRSRYGI